VTPSQSDTAEQGGEKEDRMSLEENKDIALKFNEVVFDGRDVDAVERFVSPDCCNNVTGGRGVDDFQNVARLVHQMLPDARHQTDALIAKGDQVVAFITSSGTQHGAVPMWNLTAGAKPFSWKTVHRYRTKDGKIVEHWAVRDDLGLYKQLGGTLGAS
jgi:predicted ester cyclase